MREMFFLGWRDVKNTPITLECVEDVINQARRSYIRQLLLYFATAVGAGWIAEVSSGLAAEIFYVISGFGLLFFLVGLWCFFRGHMPASRLVRKRLESEVKIFDGPGKFWFVYRDLFPMPLK